MPCLELSVDGALTFDETQGRVANLIANKIIVGHSLWNDFSGTLLSPLFSLSRSFRISLPAPSSSLPLVVLFHV